MPVTAKRLSRKWREAFAEYERHSGFEILRQADIDDGTATPKEVWEHNLMWLRDMLAEVETIRTPDEEQ